MSRKGRCDRFYSWHEEKFEWLFGILGKFISKHPLKVLITCITVNFLLMIGFINLKTENDVEVLYTPKNSQSSKDRAVLRNIFEDPTTANFQSYQLPDFGQYGDILIMSKNRSNIMSQAYLEEINNIDFYIKNSISVQDSTGVMYGYEDICALDTSGCHILGKIVFTSKFQQDFVNKNVTYPIYDTELLSPVLAQATTNGSMLLSTTGMKLRYYLRSNVSRVSSLWEKEFIQKMETLQTNLTQIAFSFSDSLGTELDKSTNSDIKFFSVTFTLMITFSYLALLSMKCNNIANRMNLATPGVLAAVLAIGSAFGFVSGIGIEFTNIVGVMPFLVIGIGIDDMFILTSGIADAPQASVSERMEFMMRKSGIAITITSLTDLLAFVIGSTSVFISIRNFCIYTGIAVFFCYLNQLFFLSPAIALNEQRMIKDSHYCVCCLKATKKEDLKQHGKSDCYIRCFAGHYPQDRSEFESHLENIPKRIVKVILGNVICKSLIVLTILGYIAASIYGVINLKQGLLLYNLASDDSYFHTYSVWDENYFTTEPIIALCIKQEQIYSTSVTQNRISFLLSKAKQNSLVDSNFEINWLTSYMNSPVFDNSSDANFINGLHQYLTVAKVFVNDIVFDSTNSTIISSKFYIKSVNIKSTVDQGNLMLKLRDLLDETQLPCFFYTPAFIFFEQYVQILSSTMQTVGIAVAVMLVITLVFMPKPVLVFVVALTLVSILLGIFGFMYFWDLTLSSITMIHLVMSVGFSVDFSVHICHAFIAVDGSDRKEILEKALDRSGGPVFNAAFSSLIGILMLFVSTSYIFLSFGKLMFLVIIFGLIHAAFFLPLTLHVILPCFRGIPKGKDQINDENSTNVNLSYVSENISNNSDKAQAGIYKDVGDGYTMYTHKNAKEGK